MVFCTEIYAFRTGRGFCGAQRAHALITKITGTHRYQLTSTGRKTIVAVLSALRSTVAQLTPVTAQLTELSQLGSPDPAKCFEISRGY